MTNEEPSTLLNIFWGSDSAWFWTMVQALGVVAGLIGLAFIYRQVKAQRISNMLVSLNSLDDRWESKKYAAARQEVCQQYLDNNRNLTNRGSLVLVHFFEELGVFHRHNLFDIGILWSLFSERVYWYWSICEDMMREYRASNQDQTFFEDFEYLVEEMKKHSKARGLEVRPRTANQIRDFAERELRNLASL